MASESANKRKARLQIVEICRKFEVSIENDLNRGHAGAGARSIAGEKVVGYICELIHSARLANSLKIGSEKRAEAHAASMEYIDRIDDLLPLLHMGGMVTEQRLSVHQRNLDTIRASYENWMRSEDGARYRTLVGAVKLCHEDDPGAPQVIYSMGGEDGGKEWGRSGATIKRLLVEAGMPADSIYYIVNIKGDDKVSILAKNVAASGKKVFICSLAGEDEARIKATFAHAHNIDSFL